MNKDKAYELTKKLSDDEMSDLFMYIREELSDRLGTEAWMDKPYVIPSGPIHQMLQWMKHNGIKNTHYDDITFAPGRVYIRAGVPVGKDRLLLQQSLTQQCEWLFPHRTPYFIFL